MKETSARLLRLLTLLQVRRVWSGDEIADRLGVTTRTVRRDIDKLRDLDYPVTAVKGLAGGYSLGAGTHLPPLLLDDDEAVALAITLRTAAASGVTGIGETALQALIKLEQVLPSRLRSRVREVQLSMVQSPGRGPTVDGALLASIGAACRDHVRLRFEYRGVGGVSSVRVTEPHELITWASRWYLVAWDVDGGDWTAFQVDRITLRQPVGPRFAPRQSPEVDAATHVARSIAQMWPDQAAIRLQAEAKNRGRTIVLVEGITDEIALTLAARRLGRDLEADGVSVVPINGAHAIGRFLRQLAVQEPDARLAGLYDEGEEKVIRAALERAGYGPSLDRSRLETVGFFACSADLEDELIRAAGETTLSKLIAVEGDARPWHAFRSQPAWHGRPLDQQFRRFIRSVSERNSRYIRAIVETIDPSRLPRPLRLLLDYADSQRQASSRLPK